MPAPRIGGTSKAYQPPRSVLEVLQDIEYEEALPAGDPRYVDARAARGSEKTFGRLARKFGWDPKSNACFAPNDKHVLFIGHIGSGKTMELRRHAREWRPRRGPSPLSGQCPSLLSRNRR
jgi:hypothetical protein